MSKIWHEVYSKPKNAVFFIEARTSTDVNLYILKQFWITVDHDINNTYHSNAAFLLEYLLKDRNILNEQFSNFNEYKYLYLNCVHYYIVDSKHLYRWLKENLPAKPKSAKPKSKLSTKPKRRLSKKMVTAKRAAPKKKLVRKLAIRKRPAIGPTFKIRCWICRPLRGSAGDGSQS